jgi:phosphoribosylanthranilate isomerase
VTRVKICGLRREGDVRFAAELGAHACGFVLSDSPRRVTPERARRLAGEAGDALTVAVVTIETADWIASALERADLRAVQLCAGADGPSVGAVKAAAVRRGLSPLVIAAADTAGASGAEMILRDARTPGAYGGTGVTLDWEAAAGGAPAAERLVLAGGLTPGNVPRAIAALHPSVVDVSGGVESAPGVKDHALLAAFFTAVDAADHGRGVRP